MILKKPCFHLLIACPKGICWCSAGFNCPCSDSKQKDEAASVLKRSCTTTSVPSRNMPFVDAVPHTT